LHLGRLRLSAHRDHAKWPEPVRRGILSRRTSHLRHGEGSRGQGPERTRRRCGTVSANREESDRWGTPATEGRQIIETPYWDVERNSGRSHRNHPDSRRRVFLTMGRARGHDAAESTTGISPDGLPSRSVGIAIARYAPLDAERRGGKRWTSGLPRASRTGVEVRGFGRRRALSVVSHSQLALKDDAIQPC